MCSVALTSRSGINISFLELIEFTWTDLLLREYRKYNEKYKVQTRRDNYLTMKLLTPELRADRAAIADEWIERVMTSPAARIVQPDGRIRLWASISEMDNRFLRVIVLEDGETVHNAFFDRRFKTDEG